MFKVGDRVKVLNVGTTRGLTVGDIRTIDNSWQGESYRLGAPLTWVSDEEIELVKPKVQMARHKARGKQRDVRRSQAEQHIKKHWLIDVKPTIRHTPEQRQFSLEFKQTCVRLVTSGPVGTAAVLSKMFQLAGNITYWKKQQADGHFDINRAVAFSRQS